MCDASLGRGRNLRRREALRAVAGAAVAATAGLLAACAPGDVVSGPIPRTPVPRTPVAPPTVGTLPVPELSAVRAVDPDHVASLHAEAAPVAWGTDLDGITSALSRAHDAEGRPRVALTLDACGGRGGSDVDHVLLDGLRAHNIPATLFLNARWIEQHPVLAAELAVDPLFELANHGTRHLPLSVTGADAYGIRGTVSAREAVDEVWHNQLVLREITGASPRYFRAGTAHYDDVAVRIVRDLGVSLAGFTVNGDGGASFSASTVRRQIVAAPPGAIVLAHMNQPGSGTADGVLRALPELVGAGTVFTHLGD